MEDGNGLQLTLFGPFAARLQGAELPGLAQQRKATQLLALLALYANRALGNEWLAAQLWPDTGSLDSLGHVAPALRRSLGAEGHRLVARSGSLLLSLTDHEADVLRFETAWERRAEADAPLREAIALYHGPLLQDWYEPWVEGLRRTYRERYIEMLQALVRLAVGQNDVPGARRGLRLLVAAGEPAEGLHTRLMEALVTTQNHLQAIQLYEDYGAQLSADYGVEPPAKLTALFNAIPRAAHAFVPTFVPEFAGELKRAEPVGGATPLDSRYYIRRAEDELFHAAIARHDGIICLKGPRQVGKTSLLARGLEQARQLGARVVITDFQTLDAAEKQTLDRFYLALAHSLAEQLEIETPLPEVWSPLLSAGANFERYLRRTLLANAPTPLVWAIDEADAIFDCDYRSSVFGLFRSWYNARALNPNGAWDRFSLLLTYSTEAHLLISNLNQSPFNVGARIALRDFDREQMEELNRRYGSPLDPTTETPRLMDLVGGHPFLARLCLYEITTRNRSLAEIEAAAVREDGLCGEHLERLRTGILRDAALTTAVGALLHGELPLPQESFLRLRSAGVLAGDSGDEARFRCHLYEKYLRTRAPWR